MNHCSDKTRAQLYKTMTTTFESAWLGALCKQEAKVNTIHFAPVFVVVDDQCPVCAAHEDVPILLLGEL
jgi:hypothetical protein